MKTLPVITILLWSAFLLGSWFLPETFRQDMIQLPTAVILSVLLPVSFWQLATTGKFFFALLFVGILCFNVSVLLVVVRGEYVAHQALVKKVNKGIQPRRAQYVETAVSEGKRRLAAQLLYQQHGIILSYKNDIGSRTLYSPSESDKEEYIKNFFMAKDLRLNSTILFTSMITSAALLLTHITLFTILLVFFILYDRNGAKGLHKVENDNLSPQSKGH
ncbi:MAG: hypothetical protein D3910_09535 [Candidatus Electrothrix sp. ATG2]|nr:hypothetical protein [Candidatus Electrothrix sp. ATG2]